MLKFYVFHRLPSLILRAMIIKYLVILLSLLIEIFGFLDSFILCICIDYVLDFSRYLIFIHQVFLYYLHLIEQLKELLNASARLTVCDHTYDVARWMIRYSICIFSADWKKLYVFLEVLAEVRIRIIVFALLYLCISLLDQKLYVRLDTRCSN